MSEDLIRSARFRAEREADWKRLQEIVTKAEKRGVRRLSFEEARDLAILYRQAVNSLSVAREISLDRALLDYLDALCARAYLAVYAPQETLAGVVWRFFARGCPQAMRRSGWHLLLSLFALSLGVVAGWLLFITDPSWWNSFIPGDLGGGRGPGASTQQLLDVIYGDGQESGSQLAAFATYLFSHNVRIAIFCFALGILACIPSFVLAVYNGIILGLFLALHFDRGIGWDLVGWLSIHGVTELAAIVIACAGGFRLGWAVIFPGNLTRRDQLRRHGRDAAKLAVLAAIMLLVAGILEGFFRQLVQDMETRLIVGWGIGLLWLLWILLAGRGSTAERRDEQRGAHAHYGGNDRLGEDAA